MPQPDHLIKMPVPAPEEVEDPGIRKYMDKCLEKLGMIPNVIQAYAYKPAHWKAFVGAYHAFMDEENSNLSVLEREMIAVVVSSYNRCYYCLVAHGAAVRKLSGDPELGEMLVMNYRVAPLDKRQRAMLDFAWKLTATPWDVVEEDRQALYEAGFSQEDVWDIAHVAGFFNLSNRVAYATDMMPNKEYHSADR